MNSSWLSSTNSPNNRSRDEQRESYGSPYVNNSPRYYSPQVKANLAFSPRSTSLSTSFNGSINSPEALESFLKSKLKEQERDRQLAEACKKTLPLDTLMMLRNLEYKSSSETNLSFEDPLPRETSYISAEYSLKEYDVWSNLRVTGDQVNLWVERLRQYICRTIYVRLSEEIDRADDALRTCGYPDIRVGRVSLSFLANMMASRPDKLSQISTLLTFLDAGDQEYIVRRIKELSSGGCLGCFRWNSGGKYKEREWSASLPTDSSLLMHFFCCYMNCMLPPDCRYIHGNKFTSLYFLKAFERPDVPSMVEGVYLIEVSPSPPRYAVVCQGRIIHVKSGATNVFHVLLLFLYLVKVRCNGMLERLSLGMGGLNVQWIFE